MSLFLDTHGFTAFIDDLTRMSGQPREKVLLDQAARVLEICIKRSPGKSSGAIRKKVQIRVEKPMRWIGEDGSLVTKATAMKVPRPAAPPFLQTLTGTRGGRAGNQWYVGRDRAGKRIVLHFSKLVGNPKYLAREAARLSVLAGLSPQVAAAIASIGSLKRSWLQIADHLGIALKLAEGSFVRKARTPFDDGVRSRFVHEGLTQFVELVNTNGMLIQKYQGGAILQGAIDTRLKAFSYELKTKVFEDLGYRAKRYPGIFVK